MNITSLRVFSIMGIALVVGCAGGPSGKHANMLASSNHQKSLECPEDLENYCGGWDVHATSYTPASEHIKSKENFVIGKKNLGGGNKQLALFPRGDLLVRWAPSNGRVDLRRIPTSGSVQCLVGKVHISGHSGGHSWHGIILTVEDQTLTPEVGDEDYLDMCLIVQQGGSWPSNCTCVYPPGDPRNHGGRAHSYD